MGILKKVQAFILMTQRPNNCFNLINPLSWFVQNNNAQTTPSPSGADLKVKPMLDARCAGGKRLIPKYSWNIMEI
jgi:hypothetical protein